jgi:hypothetical protein
MAAKSVIRNKKSTAIRLVTGSPAVVEFAGSSTRDTLEACTSIVRFVGDAVSPLQHHDGGICEHGADAVSTILNAVGDALNREATPTPANHLRMVEHRPASSDAGPAAAP